MRREPTTSCSEEGRIKLELIYREYRSPMLAVANRILGDTRDSEDVVHQVFVKLLKIADRLEAPRSPTTKGLVLTVTERTAIDLYRSRQRRQTVPFDEEYLSLPETAGLDAAAERTDLAAAMARLPARYRQVLLLRYDSGFSCGEIAGLLSMSEGNVRKTIQRAKERLAEQLSEGGAAHRADHG